MSDDYALSAAAWGWASWWGRTASVTMLIALLTASTEIATVAGACCLGGGVCSGLAGVFWLGETFAAGVKARSDNGT